MQLTISPEQISLETVRIFVTENPTLVLSEESKKRILTARATIDKIIESGMKISFDIRNGLRLDKVNDVLLSKMKKAGCSTLCLGIESGSDRILKILNKGINKNKITEIYTLLSHVCKFS